ncbi:MAG: hypothetical protein P4L57_03160 [Rhizomicrobium sp.]|nr:hypothetical protein [Rhizomicrobium sp.]
MKLLIRDYLASLRERQELDVVLPDLLSELGFHVYSRPGIGTTQRGVDIAAVGNDNGVKKVFLFSVKAGDLSRKEWNGGPQALRQSVEEILELYIPERIPAEYRKLKIVICLCFGGEILEPAQPLVRAFIKKYSKGKISFQEWNGDKLAEMILAGVLREQVLPKPLRSHFQKAVAMVDQPDISYEHFARLVTTLRKSIKTDKDRVRVARQISICLRVLFVWARDADNLDAPYRASELALLNCWELVKPYIGKKTANARAVVTVVRHVIELHITISSLYLENKILPYVGRHHALSLAVWSGESVDVNLKMFEVLGRLALRGHWLLWSSTEGGAKPSPEQIKLLHRLVTAGFELIQNNPCLNLPLMDEQAIEVALFLSLAVQVGSRDPMARWLSEMVTRYRLTVNGNGQYPCVFREYRDLIDHPKVRTEKYRQEATTGSVLIPLLAAWLTAFGDTESLKGLVGLKAKPLAHCTLQLWMPDANSEAHFYINDAIHGIGIDNLPLTGDGAALMAVLKTAVEKSDGFSGLSAFRAAYFPVLLTACRHYRLPLPPQFWIGALIPDLGKPAS